MDKKFLKSLNSLQYSDKELEEMEKQANSQEIDMDEYFIRNASLKRKLAIETLEKSIRKQLEQDEIIEKSVTVNSAVYQMPNLYSWGASIHYYIAVTNRRLFIVGLDYNYKSVASYIKSFQELEGVIDYWKDKSSYGICGLVLKDTTLTLSCKENKTELLEIIKILVSKGVKKVCYKDIEANSSNKPWIIAYVILLGIPFALLLKYILERI